MILVRDDCRAAPENEQQESLAGDQESGADLGDPAVIQIVIENGPES
jgi:hypothetical protein